MATIIGYSNSIVSLQNGANALAGQGEQYSFTLALPGSGGEDTIILTDSSTGFQTQVGFGNVTGVNFNFVEVFNEKVYGLAGSKVYVSAVNDPTTWNNPNGVGNGYVQLSNWYSTPENLQAVAPYQGRLAFFTRRTAQVFIIDADLSKWQQQQILTNIGAVASLSVQSLGDLDVMFLSDTGIRSLRVRDMSLNAYVNDLGSPIDSLIQTALLSGNGPTACGVVEPQANRYWLYLNGLIYVLSFFPSSKIQAWSTYVPTYANDFSNSQLYGAVYGGGGTVQIACTQGRDYYWSKGANDVSITDTVNTYNSSTSFTAKSGILRLTGTAGQLVTAHVVEQTPFVPQKFVIFAGQVYTRDASGFYIYGGTNNNTYDGCICTVATSWLDAKTPTLLKKAKALDSAFQGAWSFSAGMDQLSGSLKQIWMGTKPTFQLGTIPWSADGYHVKFQALTTDNNYARLSSLVFTYEESKEKA